MIRICSLCFLLAAWVIPDRSVIHPPERTILFSGLRWRVRDTKEKQGPGPNYFGDTGVRVDSLGFLHMAIRRDLVSGNWYSSEVTTEQSFGFGEYVFSVEGPIDRMDRNVVLGLFNYSGNDGLDEMDIEFARWGNDRYPNLNYTIWPADKNAKNYSYTRECRLTSFLTTHRFRRTPDSVFLSSYAGIPPDGSEPIARASCGIPGQSVSRLRMPVHINLWLFNGHPPADGKEVELIIRAFRYTAQ
jgi:hypothetical protein